MADRALVTVDRDGDIAWVTVDNPPVNATSRAVRAGLMGAVNEVVGARVAILRCAGRTFIAGGDLSEFDAPPQEPHLSDVVQAIEDSPVPFVALLHGSVLGGGLEIALGAAWRIAAPGTRFGLPEVNVGLIPGAGGTQRLPRLIGMAPAIDMAVSGKTFDADTMRQLGGIDLIAEGELEDVARKFVAELPPRPTAISAREVPEYPATMIGQRRADLDRRSRGQASPFEVLEALAWTTLPFAEGQARERARHLELRRSPGSRALRHVFFAERAVARPAAISGATARVIDRAAVVGGGLMGAGIATSLLGAGIGVTLIERNREAADGAVSRVRALLEGAAKRGKISAADLEDGLAAFTVSTDYGDAAGADLAIEAVFEDATTKRDVFTRLAAVMGREAMLATNTSYLDPRQLFSGIDNPARCLGLHFFSPAHIMRLLEVIRLPDTSAEVLATGFALGKRLGKVPVLSGICDGFIGNRMLAAARREADYLLEDGALPHEVDAAIRGFGAAMGPYEMQDLTGLQIAWANRKRLAASRDPAERYVTIADQLCEMGRFGQRSSKGWYRYVEGDRTPIRDTQVEALIEAEAAALGITRRSFSADEITDRLLAVLANEGARIVEEGVAENDAAVDVVKVHGYGFPRWRGGPMHYAGATGWSRVAQTMGHVAEESPNSWRLAERLARLAAT